MSGFVRYSSNVFLRFDLPQIGLKWEFFGQSETRKGRIRNNLRFAGCTHCPLQTIAKAATWRQRLAALRILCFLLARDSSCADSRSEGRPPVGNEALTRAAQDPARLPIGRS